MSALSLVPRLRLCLVGFLSVLLPWSALAQQNTATILGTLTDPSGAAIPGVKVTATDELTSYARGVQSASDGSYLIPLLPISSKYKLTIEARLRLLAEPALRCSSTRMHELTFSWNSAT